MKKDQLGEYFILDMLNNWIPSNEAKTSAAGLRGDNFTYYEKENDYLFTWNIMWQSLSNAQEFTTTFENMLSAAGATKIGNNDWIANGPYLSVTWKNGDYTIIRCSTNETVIQHDTYGISVRKSLLTFWIES